MITQIYKLSFVLWNHLLSNPTSCGSQRINLVGCEAQFVNFGDPSGRPEKYTKSQLCRHLGCFNRDLVFIPPLADCFHEIVSQGVSKHTKSYLVSPKTMNSLFQTFSGCQFHLFIRVYNPETLYYNPSVVMDSVLQNSKHLRNPKQ